MTVAQVIDTSTAYKTNPNKRYPDRGDFPLGTIKLRSLSSNQAASDFYAYPAFNSTTIPLLGELVTCFSTVSDYGDGLHKEQAWFYISPINLHGNVNLNPTGLLYTVPAGGSANSYTSTAAPKNVNINDYKPGENFLENENIKNIQPYEGDVLLQGRFGQSIRFGSTLYGNRTSQYAEKPFWKGKTNPSDPQGYPLTKGSPITIISNGHESTGGSNRYIIEDPAKTKSIMIMSSDQQIKFETSQQRVGVGVSPIGLYDKSQVIISADRLIFNSKLDEIILSGKKTVNIATPKWQMDMDKLFTILEGVLQQLADLTAGKAQFQTPMGGPTLTATNVTQVQKLLTDLKLMKQ